MSFGKSILIGMGLGALVGLFMCSIALDHNPQGEFADTLTGQFTSDLYMLFALWTLFAGVPSAALLAFVGYLRRQGD